MANEVPPDSVYIGQRDDMIAEVGAWDPRCIGIPPRACKYLVMPVGAAEWSTEWHASRAAALTEARWIAKHYGVPVHHI